MSDEKPKEEPQEEPQEESSPQVDKDELGVFAITDPFEMMRRLGRRPTDEQLKKYEEQEKALQKKNRNNDPEEQGDQTKE